MTGRISTPKVTGQKGLTLIELMIVVAVIAILVAITVPSFKAQLESSRTQAVMASFITGMAYARSESVKTGVSVHLRSINNSNNWSGGWCVTTKNHCDSDYVKSFKPAGAFSLVGNSGATTRFTFNAQGLLESSSGSVSLCTSEVEGKKISVTLLGQALARKCICNDRGICE